MVKPKPKFLTVAATAEQLCVTPGTVRSLLADPNAALTGMRVGRVLRVDRKSLKAYMAANAYPGQQRSA